MKHIYLYWLLCFPLLSFAQSGKYSVNGKIGTDRNKQTIYLYYNVKGQEQIDSCVIKQGQFSFSGSTVNADWAYLTLRKPGTYNFTFFVPNPITFYLQSGEIKVSSPDSLLHARLSGNPLTNEYQLYRDQLQPYEEELFALEVRYYKVAADTSLDEFCKAHLGKLVAATDAMKKVTRSFIKNHPESLVSGHIITSNASSFPDVNETDHLIRLLSPNIRKLPKVALVADFIAAMMKTELGQIAPEFSQNDTAGHKVSLKDFKGKYVLLDFWASWCGPCRADNPNVLKAYTTFKEKNFTVLSVSLDKAGGKQAWINAIKMDGMPWTHVSDLNFFDNAVAKLYAIKAVPQNFLINPDGVIIAKNLHGDALQTKLKEILGSNDPNSSKDSSQ